jgi:hypothetical protein
LAVVAATLGAFPLSAHAATVSMTASDTFGNSSFNSAGNWDSFAAPTAGNDYSEAGWLLRTPGDAGDYTFAGDSLTIVGNIGDPTLMNRALMWKGTGTTAIITVNNLTLQDGGWLRHGQGTVDTFHLAGNSLTIGSGGANMATQGGMIIDSPIAGSDSLTIADSGSSEVGRMITFTSGASTFNGNVALATARSRLTLADGSLFNFTIGSTGVNNAFTGTGVLNLNGTFKLDLSGAGTTVGDSWSLVDSSVVATYGGTFSIQDFTQDSILTNLWTSTSGTYQYDTTTGVLSAVPEPNAFAMLLGGGIGILLLRFRRSSRRNA